MQERKQDKPDDPPYSGGEDEGSGAHQQTSKKTPRSNNRPVGESNDGEAARPVGSPGKDYVAPNGKNPSAAP
jgi:hypothetical protein